MSDQNGRTRGTCGRPKANGEPCGMKNQPPEGCAWHREGADPTALAKLGGAVSAIVKGHVLPRDTPVPQFQSRDQVVAYAENRAHLVEVGQLDPRRSVEARGWADLAMKAWELEALLRLNKIERHLKRKRAT